MGTRDLGRLRAVGDSLSCGLQGWDVDPGSSFFAHLCRAWGQRVSLPKLRWNLGSFRAVCELGEETHTVQRVLRLLEERKAEICWYEALPPSDLFAAPGFSSRAFLHQHEQSPGLPSHLRQMVKPFLNPGDEVPATFLERLAEAPPAGTYVVWLGGVEWISMTLDPRRRFRAISRQIERNLGSLVERLIDFHRARRLADPRIVLCGLISPAALPLYQGDPRADRRIAFGTREGLGEAHEVLSAGETATIHGLIASLNGRLREIADAVDGVFVDFDGLYQEALRAGEARLPGAPPIPAEAMAGLDLVHPTRTGHAVLAAWIADALGRVGLELPAIPVADVYAEQCRLEARIDRSTWRRVVAALYENYLYRASARRAALATAA